MKGNLKHIGRSMYYCHKNVLVMFYKREGSLFKTWKQNSTSVLSVFILFSTIRESLSLKYLHGQWHTPLGPPGLHTCTWPWASILMYSSHGYAYNMLRAWPLLNHIHCQVPMINMCICHHLTLPQHEAIL